MTNEEILKRAIEKAVKNGYRDWGMPRGFAIYSVIFSHDFAKAFFGEVRRYRINANYIRTFMPAWQYHLQQMVLEKDPISYLAKFL